jgi:hypothetical protein
MSRKQQDFVSATPLRHRASDGVDLQLANQRGSPRHYDDGVSLNRSHPRVHLPRAACDHNIVGIEALTTEGVVDVTAGGHVACMRIRLSYVSA